MNGNTNIDVKNLSSRKLFELLSQQNPRNSRERILIEGELLFRKHYLHELKNLQRCH